MAKSGVFISYARKDGEQFANEIRERLKNDAPDVCVWQDRQEIEGGVGWWRQIEEALERVEFLVTVLTDASLTSDVTRKEWRTARQKGVCVYPVKGPGFDFSDLRLTRWMKKAHIYDLDIQWKTFVEHIRRGCRTTRVPFMAPDLPAGFVQRSSEFEQLRSLLLVPQQRDPVAITTAVTGAGGFGKTTLACALCHDDDIALAFDDGILWTTLGQRPHVADALAKLYAGLTGERPQFKDAEDAATTLAEKLEYKNCLINAVALTPDGNCAVSGSSDNTLKIWDLESGRELHTLEGHRGTIRAVALTPDGRRAVSASDDCTVAVWNVATGTLGSTFGADAAVQACAAAFDGLTFVAGDTQGCVHVLRLENPT